MKTICKTLIILILLQIFCNNIFCQSHSVEIENLVKMPAITKYYKNLKTHIDTVKHVQSYTKMNTNEIVKLSYCDYQIDIFDDNEKLFSKLYGGKAITGYDNIAIVNPVRSGEVFMDEIYDVLLKRTSENDLQEIAVNVTSDKIGLSVVKRISKKSILDYIALNAKKEIVRKAAKGRLNLLNTWITGTLTDPRDGKVYKTIKIGTQWIMSENLSYKPREGKYWAYEYNPEKYGYAYNWETAKTITPDGWHLPSKEEWETLYNLLGRDEKKVYSSMIDGGTSGFNALFYGYCEFTGNFFGRGDIAQYWSSTSTGGSEVYTFRFNSNFFSANLEKEPDVSGYNVRLIQNCEQHTWKTCKCSTCGKIRDEQHNWLKNCNTCSVCGKERTDGHSFVNGICTKCGIKQPNEGTFIDNRDSRLYKTIQISDQIIMAENFAYKPEKGLYWAYENNSDKYGYAYNWETAESIAPTGWHVPTKEEWEKLYKDLGNNNEEIFKSIKPGGSSYFNALLVGYVYDYRFRKYPDEQYSFWSSTANGSNEAFLFNFVGGNSVNSKIGSAYKTNGFSIRLFKDK